MKRSATICAAIVIIARAPLIVGFPPAYLTVIGLRTEYQTNPLGIDVRQPRLSWQLHSNQRGVLQSAYQIRVGRNERELLRGTHLLWDSGKVESAESIHRIYDGRALQSGQRCYWQVRVWDNKGEYSAWSEPAYWEMGLLQPSDWQAQWIEPDLKEDPSKFGPAPILRRVFKVEGVVEKARAYITSHGLYESQLNGKPVSDDLFRPGRTSYNKRLQYETYDVTNLLRQGENTIGVVLGDGWYRGQIIGSRNVYGSRLGLLFQIKITYRDGHEQTVISDEHWKATTGPILFSSIYDGETYDARLEKTGWTMPGFNDSDWSAVKIVSHPKDILVAQIGPPVRRIEELKPIKILKTPAGETVVDMGQNMVGWVRLKVQGPRGTTVTLRHAEVLDKQGNFYTQNLRGAKQTIRYTLSGNGLEVFEPHFSFQGFRYVAVDGYPGELVPDSLTGIVIHSDLPLTGHFETSSPLINQLQHNILWSQKGNFLDIPTDCPQRDERLGWTGDAQIFARTAAFNMDVAPFFAKWLKDMAADQFEDGSVPSVIPTWRIRKTLGGAAGWSDAAVIIPWEIYLSYGDTQILKDQYQSMSRLVDYERERAGDDYIWDGDFQFGDTLAFATPDPAYPGATTEKDLIATAFFAHSTDLMQHIATVLGKQADAASYAELLKKTKTAFNREFVTQTGRVGENTQTAYVLALQFDLLPEELRPVAAKRLARDVRERKHLTTGFLGTPYLLRVLTRYGYLDEAYMLLNREEFPSWLYPVKQGATTIWERWDGIKTDGSFQDPTMNSFNHYSYGVVGDWMYPVMAGIEIDEAVPSYKHILIQPQPGGGFTYVRANHETMYGKVTSAWTINNGHFELSIETPANTTATVRLPNALLAKVTESDKVLTKGNGIRDWRQDGSSVVVEIGSGSFRFAAPIEK